MHVLKVQPSGSMSSGKNSCRCYEIVVLRGLKDRSSQVFYKCNGLFIRLTDLFFELKLEENIM